MLAYDNGIRVIFHKPDAKSRDVSSEKEGVLHYRDGGRGLFFDGIDPYDVTRLIGKCLNMCVSFGVVLVSYLVVVRWEMHGIY